MGSTTNLNPSQRRSDLHILHLLFRLGIQFYRELGGLFMVRPSIVVLQPSNKSKWTNRTRKRRRRTCRYRSKLARLLLCASRASTPAFSSYRLQEYHAVPCSDHGPIHTQQNSCLHFLHVIWLSNVGQQKRRIISRRKKRTCTPHSSQSCSDTPHTPSCCS